MIYVLYGALGAVCVLALVGLGFLAGWKVRGSRTELDRKEEEREVSAEERRRAEEERRAYEAMLGYSPAAAYGGQYPERENDL